MHRDRAVLVEACVETLNEALAAEQAGAHRLELCAGLVEGGTTPTVATIEAVCARVSIPVCVMVRPRGGDFVYDADELAIMERDIGVVRSAGAHGIVSGALTASATIDRPALHRLLEASRPLPFTFHRAVDCTTDLDAALDLLVALGVTRVLSSGGATTALEGAARLAALVRRTTGALTMLAGGGVRAVHAAALVRQTGVREMHARPLRPRGITPNQPGSRSGFQVPVRASLDPDAIRDLVAAVRDAT